MTGMDNYVPDCAYMSGRKCERTCEAYIQDGSGYIEYFAKIGTKNEIRGQTTKCMRLLNENAPFQAIQTSLLGK